MKSAPLRNIGILAHIDAGKTTVSERILFYSGVERRLGEVHDGTTVMDWMPEERDRGITITATVTSCPWAGHRIQLIDTPGHVDFTAEVARSLRVLDGAVVVLDGVSGPQAQTESVVRQARHRHLPLLLFVNKMDRPGADFARALQLARERLQVKVVAVQLPYGEGREFTGVVDLIKMKLLSWSEVDQGKTITEQNLPDAVLEDAQLARAEMCSAIAEQREKWSHHYLEHDDLPNQVILEALRLGTLEQILVPALCGSALHNTGIQPLLDAVVDYFPAPWERPAPTAMDPDSGVRLSVPPEEDGAIAAFCFKVTHEKHGDLVYLRMFSGTLRPGDTLINVRTRHREKLQTLYAMHAVDRENLDSVAPGGLLAVTGLPRVQTGDTLCSPERLLLMEPILFPEPVLRQAIEARDATEQAKLEQALQILVREDPTLEFAMDEVTGGFMLAGMGELHLEIAVHRLSREFKLDVRAGMPRVRYCETIAKAVQSHAELHTPGEEGQKLEVTLGVEPQEEEVPQLQISPACPVLPPALLEVLRAPNLLKGWGGNQGHPLARVRLMLHRWATDSQQQPSQELFLGALQVAVAKAFRAESMVLEPQMALEVHAPEKFFSGVLADLQKRHAKIQEVESEQDWRRITALVPLSRMAAYSTDLRSLTQGMAVFHMHPDELIARETGNL
ncbi:MAG: TetM/TetW/TetO/TetS family tetracycline resistance ribosomal protection protein [Planctomycetota bacterium]|nr:TetM/TetW/TetO/TetS family tetracycline resistance ribosomal protection protein [Planctomycetota bacterium]MDA1112821.1 TetM/TetW/TetO/TetS family tetracycline resistance ribosomal protection protein [Planctomycetota bacterium]